MHLKPQNLEYIIQRAEVRIARKYITSIFQKTLSLKDKERRDVAEKIIKEARQIETVLSSVSLNSTLPSGGNDSPLKAILALAEVVKCDSVLVTLELIKFIKKYPDVTRDQVTCLLRFRGDFSRQRACDMLKRMSTFLTDETTVTSIFSQIPVPRSIFV